MNARDYSAELIATVAADAIGIEASASGGRARNPGLPSVTHRPREKGTQVPRSGFRIAGSAAAARATRPKE